MGPNQRLVDCPDQVLLNEDEVAWYLRFSVATLNRLIERGDFPKPMENSDRGRVWHWRDTLWYLLGMELRSRLAKNFDPQEGSGRGQEGSNAKRAKIED